MKYVINEELMKSLVNYLVSRPYAEVFMLLDQVRNIQGLPDAPKEEVASDAAPEEKSA